MVHVCLRVPWVLMLELWAFLGDSGGLGGDIGRLGRLIRFLLVVERNRLERLIDKTFLWVVGGYPACRYLLCVSSFLAQWDASRGHGGGFACF